jgi:hypothetical protein
MFLAVHGVVRLAAAPDWEKKPSYSKAAHLGECRHDHHNCMALVTAEDVVRAAREPSLL